MLARKSAHLGKTYFRQVGIQLLRNLEHRLVHEIVQQQKKNQEEKEEEQDNERTWRRSSSSSPHKHQWQRQQHQFHVWSPYSIKYEPRQRIDRKTPEKASMMTNRSKALQIYERAAKMHAQAAIVIDHLAQEARREVGQKIIIIK